MSEICATCFHPPGNHRGDGCTAFELPEFGFRLDCPCGDYQATTVLELYPTSVFDAAGRFQGHQGGSSEHRTVGDHRAWCLADSEWCYPADGCRCCTADS